MHKNPNHDQHRYNFSGVEKIINTIISFIFYYRLAFVFLGFGSLSWFAYRIWKSSPATEELKNMATVMTCGSIMVAIFYSILNYEYTQIRFKHDKKIAREVLTFNVASEWHKSMSDHSRILAKFRKQCKEIIEENNAKKFHEELEKEEHEEQKKAFLGIFNYFESIALGVKQGIMDEDFIKGFFSTAFQQYFNENSFYIEYRRKVKNMPKIWENFSRLVKDWMES